MGIRTKNRILFSIFALATGAAAGVVVWALLYVMSLGINLVWETFPQYVGGQTIVFNLVICIIGGIWIGLWQKKYGDLPDTMEIVMGQLKKNGTYPYNNIHILAVAALVPIIFGGALGPEAGLTGIIVGLCCWAGDKFKYKSMEIRELAEAGTAATLGIIFQSPFFGIANNLENNPDERENTHGGEDSQKHATKKDKTTVYVLAVIGGFAALMLLSNIIGGGMGLARYTRESVEIGGPELIMLIPLAAIGTLAGVFYLVCNKLAYLIIRPVSDKKVLRGVIGGILLAVIGFAFPWTMFSGEHEMSQLMTCWGELGFAALLTNGIVKLLLINICINCGWKGGNIFPIIFSATSIGYAMAVLTGVNPVFCVGITVGALCGYIMRKPVTVVAFLVICFPVNVLIPMAAAAYIGSIVPVFKFLKVGGEE